MIIPYPYNMVDMGGIDLAEANGTVVAGVYDRITDAVSECGYLVLYNWKFAKIEIVPSVWLVEPNEEGVVLNEIVQVTELDRVVILGIDPPPVAVEPLEVTENGIYTASQPPYGFNPVRVEVPGPVIQPLSITENGSYSVASGVDGYSPITVNVRGGSLQDTIFVSRTQGDYINGWYGGRTFTRSLASGAKFIAAPWRFDRGYVAGAFYTLVDHGDVSNVGGGDYAAKVEIPDVEIPNYGTVTVYAYGGLNGAGRNGTVNFYNKSLTSVYSNIGAFVISMSGATVGSAYRFGPTSEANLGEAFSSMSSEMQEEFLTSLLQTLN